MNANKEAGRRKAGAERNGRNRVGSVGYRADQNEFRWVPRFAHDRHDLGFAPLGLCTLGIFFYLWCLRDVRQGSFGINYH